MEATALPSLAYTCTTVAIPSWFPATASSIIPALEAGHNGAAASEVAFDLAKERHELAIIKYLDRKSVV